MALEPIKDDGNPVEEILLYRFPNPERIGCPSSDVIKDLANHKLSRGHDSWRHIWSCSPCYRDYKAVADQRLAIEESKERRTQVVRRVLSAAAMLVIAAGLSRLWIYSTDRARHSAFAVVTIDLSATRGTEAAVAKLPQSVVEIHLTFPPYSNPGFYSVAILPSKVETTAVALGSGRTSGSNDSLQLSVTLDLSAVTPGRYFLGTRQGQGQTAFYFPILIQKTI